MDTEGRVFADETEWDVERRAMKYFVDIEEMRIVCRISEVALQDYFRVPSNECTRERAIENYNSYCDRIHDLTLILIQEDAFDEDGEIFLSKEVCTRYRL